MLQLLPMVDKRKLEIQLSLYPADLVPVDHFRAMQGRLIRICVKTNRNAIRSSNNNNNYTTMPLCPHRHALTRNKQCKHAIYINQIVVC